MRFLAKVIRMSIRFAPPHSQRLGWNNSSINNISVRCMSDDKRFKIYTKTGDKGRSSVFTGERRAKSDEVFHALGATDELTAHIGMCRELCGDGNPKLQEQLLQIQCLLQEVMSSVATPRSSARQAHIKRTEFSACHVDQLEQWIDEMDASLPPLTNFILPGGTQTSCALHVARAVCRRAERGVVPLLEKEEVEDSPYKFLNRLSDYLFTAARLVCQEAGRDETIYKKVEPSSS